MPVTDLPREQTFRPGELVHPTYVNGRQLWVSPEVEDIVHKLHYGDLILGWEGDPRLALYIDEEQRWVLERLEADGEYRPVCRSKPGLALDERLIIRLMEHDHRRGFDAAALPEGRPEDPEADDRMREGLERVYWGLKRDLDR